ncbi:MAG: sulfatase [Mangrovibacterium sp.]
MKILTNLITIAACCNMTVSAQPGRPNVLLVVSDDQSAVAAGCYGNKDISTPNIDNFARQGIRFTRAYVTCPQCSPSRSSMITGRSPIALGTTRFYSPLFREFKMLTEYLRELGYYTGITGRQHHLDGGASHDSTYLAAYERSLELTIDDRADYVRILPKPKDGNGRIVSNDLSVFLSKKDPGQPFFLQLNYWDPHLPHTAPKFHDSDKLSLPVFYPDTKLVREFLAAYYDEIHRFDQDFATVLKYLDDHNLAQNTIVIYLSDNGGAQFRGKGTLYENGIRVPFIVRWPEKIKSGQVCNEVISAEDITPTILNILGYPVPKEMTGISFKPLLNDPAKSVRKYVYAERGVHGSKSLPEKGSSSFELQRCIVSMQYKLIFNVTNQFGMTPVGFDEMKFFKELKAMNASGQLQEPFKSLYFSDTKEMFELYDLQNDPFEMNNLFSDSEYQKVRDELALELSYWMLKERDFVNLPGHIVSGDK